MPEKKSSIMVALLGSVGMMMFVSVLFHLPAGGMNLGVASNFLAAQKKNNFLTSTTIYYGSIDPATASYLVK